jgi:hypothetical protein
VVPGPPPATHGALSSTPSQHELESAVLELLAARGTSRTACPSEVARSVGGDTDERWRPLMEPVREAVRSLAAQGRVEVLQRGRRIDPSTARGPIRIRATGDGRG